MAKLQELPNDRLQVVKECKPHLLLAGRGRLDTDAAYLGTNFLLGFFMAEVRHLLDGTIVCRDSEGSGPIRESVLRNVPLYNLKLEQDTEVDSYLDTPYLTSSREIAESASSYGMELDPSGY